MIAPQYHSTTGKRTWLFWCILVYVIVGFVLLFVDPYVLPVYLTLLPLQSLFLFLATKSNNFIFILFCSLLFVAFGIGSTTFFLDRENMNSVGFGAIGNFDFSYSRLFDAYSYLFVFLSALTIFIFLFKRRSHRNFIIKFLREEFDKVRLLPSAEWSLIPLITLVVFFLFVSVWMYNNHIGMIGLRQRELPFHLTGILFYSRRFIFPLILLWTFYKTRAKGAATIILVFYALVVGVVATSKSVALILLLPLILFNYVTGKKTASIITLVAAIIIYAVVGTIRSFIFENDAEVDLMTVFSNSYVFFGGNAIVYIINNFTSRLYGLQSLVLTDQFSLLSFSDLINYYTGTPLTEIIDDIPRTLFGINLPGDRAYGVGVGYTGTMILLSNHNYLYVVIQAFIISLVFAVQNNSIQKFFNSRGLLKFKIISLLIVFYSFLDLFDGNRMTIVYLSTILLVYLSNRFAVSSTRQRVINKVI